MIIVGDIGNTETKICLVTLKISLLKELLYQQKNKSLST